MQLGVVVLAVAVLLLLVALAYRSRRSGFIPIYPRSPIPYDGTVPENQFGSYAWGALVHPVQPCDA